MRKLSTIVFVAFMQFTANAQNVQLGIRGGLNISKESDHSLYILNTGTEDFETNV